MTLTAAGLAAVLAQETGEAFAHLVSIEHDSMSTVYLTDNSESLTRGGHEYVRVPMYVRLSASGDNELPRAELQIDNVDRSLVETIRTLTGQPVVTIVVVLASDPDAAQPEAGPLVFTLKDVTYDALTIRGEVSFEPWLTEPYNFRKVTPNDFPGMFTAVR